MSKQKSAPGPVGQSAVGKKIVENRGKSGGTTMTKMIGAEKLSGPSGE